jgi:hypothetical protein
MSNRELLCLALKVMACGPEENFIHVDILWPRFRARSYPLVALLVVNQRAPNCEKDRDPGARRKVLEELAGANICPANRDWSRRCVLMSDLRLRSAERRVRTN